MDFSYEYTSEQQAFRAEVSDWLDRNAPLDANALLDSADGRSDLRTLALRLGVKGWLAASETRSDGGAGLSTDLTVVLLEELNRRGLLFIVKDEAQALRTALVQWRPPGHDSDLTLSLASGRRAVWRHQIAVSTQAVGPPTVDPDSVGVTATPDADGYILNGAGLFTGLAPHPDVLWTVTLLQPATPSPSTGESRGEGETTVHSHSSLLTPLSALSLLIDASTKGISYHATRPLTPAAPRPVHFDNVWVLRTDSLGPEGEGHNVIRTRVTFDPRADLPSWVETETGALLEYARATESDGRPLSADPIRAQILVEAYIASQVSRLLRMRSQWLEQNGEDPAQANAIASLWRRATASALSDAVRQVVGPHALLSAEDPNAADGGRFDRLIRRELAEREPGDPDREALASKLRLDQPAN